MTAEATLFAQRPLRAIWPDATPGVYLMRDAMDALQVVEVERVCDSLVVKFTGCDEHFLAEDLAAEFEGPLTTEQIEAARAGLAGVY